MGGVALVETYMARGPYGLRSLVEWFGKGRVRDWVEAYENALRS